MEHGEGHDDLIGQGFGRMTPTSQILWAEDNGPASPTDDVLDQSQRSTISSYMLSEASADPGLGALDAQRASVPVGGSCTSPTDTQSAREYLYFLIERQVCRA